MTKSLIGTDFYYNAANAPQKVGYVSPAEKRFIKKTNIENKQKKLNAFRLEAQSLLNNMCHAPHPQRDLEQFKKLLKKAPSVLLCTSEDIELAYGSLTKTTIPKRWHKLFGTASNSAQKIILHDLILECRNVHRKLNGDVFAISTTLSKHIESIGVFDDVKIDSPPGISL